MAAPSGPPAPSRGVPGAAPSGVALVGPAANIDFIDQTSKLYFGRIDRHTYASNINAFLPGDNQPVLDCIFAQLEQVPGR